MTQLEIPAGIFEQMVAQVKTRVPVEACGILAGRDNKVEKLYEMTNKDNSSEHFMMEPKEQFAVVKDIRSAGLKMLAIYHSHPTTLARPSQEDIRLSLTQDVTYIIVSLQDSNRPVIHGFLIENGSVTKVPVKILPKQGFSKGNFMCFTVWTLLMLSVSLTVFGCKQNILEKDYNFVLRPGDLLFQDLDSGPLCDAIEKVTTGYRGANFSHVGIVAKDDSGDIVVIEAVSSGVEVTPLQTFLDRGLDADRRPKVVVGRLKRHYRRLVPSALKEALALKGKPYDKVFAIGNEAYYCSELIYEIFLRANDNDPIFKLQPMTFKDTDTRETLTTWQEYFSRLGVPIPEGQPGINPGGISCSPVLTIVHRYGTPSKSPLHQAE